MSKDPLVLFMPSGKRGNFLSVLQSWMRPANSAFMSNLFAADAVFAGRCQVEIQFGKFAKHGIESTEENISGWSNKEVRYTEKRGSLKEGRRLSCSSTIQGPLVVDIPADTVVNRQTIRKEADSRVITRNPAIHMCYVEVEEPDMHKPLGDLDRLNAALERDWAFTIFSSPNIFCPKYNGCCAQENGALPPQFIKTLNPPALP